MGEKSEPGFMGLGDGQDEAVGRKPPSLGLDGGVLGGVDLLVAQG